jgi:hypothetical protein
MGLAVSRRTLVLAGVAALSLLFASQVTPLAAAGLEPGRVTQRAVSLALTRDDALPIPAHFRRATSYYCYPRNYWWFYRPYTTAAEGYARCMPYFHYPAPLGPGRALKSDREMK